MADWEGEEEEEPTFESLGLSPEACAAISRIECGRPSNFQVKTLPDMLFGKDLFAKVLNIDGYDKTTAYLVTMLEKLKHHGGGVRALILTPTREMACRSFKYAEKLAGFTDVVISLLVDGDNTESQLERLAQKPDAIIATPDTLIQHLSLVDLHTVELFVIDGAFGMIYLGFANHLNQILGQLGQNRQTLLFTSYKTRPVRELMNTILRDPKIVQPCKTSEKLEALNLSLLTLGDKEQLCEEQPNNLQGPSPSQCVDANGRKRRKRKKKGAIHDGTEGKEQRCEGKPNNLQGPSPSQCVDVNARNKKRAVHDGMEGGGFKRRAENSMDED